jgi:hypothetical protein
MESGLIAPCGMNCNLCAGHFRVKGGCGGCRTCTAYRTGYLAKCRILNCDIIKMNGWNYCSLQCVKFPCQRLKSLDKRYRSRYQMSMIENLEYIERYGIRKFIQNEKRRWVKGRMIFCVHDGKYHEYPVSTSQ